jgi:hypothetical protein
VNPTVPLLRGWLIDSPVGALCDGRVATVYVPVDGTPAVRIGNVTGGPATTAQTNLDVVEAWNVALYVHAGRRSAGRDDLPDEAAAWAVVAAIAEAVRALDGAHYVNPATGARIVAARVVSAAPGVDPDTGEARATVTLAVSVWQ